MKKLKKLTLLLIATLSTLAIASGCDLLSSPSTNSSTDSSVTSSEANSNSETNSENNSESNSNSESGSEKEETPEDSSETPDGGETPDDGDDPTPEDPVHNELCDFSEWELTTAVSCKAAGEMTRYCLEDATHTQTQAIPRRPHDFGNNGLCECGSSPTIPTLSSSGAINPTATDSGIHLSDPYSQTIEMYNRYILSVDQVYTAVTNKSGEFWFQFSVPSAGQYAIVSLSNPNALTVERYDANAQYVNPSILEGRIMNDGNFISTVSVDDVHFNEEWLTVGCIRSAAAGKKVNFAIVRVDDASWKPSSIYESIYAKQINGVKAPEGAAGTKPIDVPYTTNGIYLDSKTGWYCMPSGEVIYAAITKKAERQFGGGTIAFTDLLAAGSAQNFRIQQSTLPSGDYLIYDYATLLMADPTLEGLTYNENSYEAQVNSDGLYPVTQELYNFLVAHASRNTPATAPDAG